MILRITPILLALMCLVTTIAPAVADTPSVKPYAGPGIIYDRVKEGLPGARLDLQMQLLFQTFGSGELSYIRQRGRFTQDAQEAIGAGVFPFLPIDADGTVWPVIELPGEETPPPATIGLRTRPTDHLLMIMGADGDPLAPRLESFEPNWHPLGWPVEYPWRMRLAQHLREAVRQQFHTGLALSNSLPSTPAELQRIVEMAPAGCSWRTDGPGDAIAVEVEIDRTRQMLRLTATPQPDSVPPLLLQVSPTGPMLITAPYFSLQPANWESWGVLVWDAPLPEELTGWSPPAPPPYEPEKWGHGFGSSGAGRVSQELALIGAWYRTNLGRMPTVDELLAADWGLHVPLAYDGSPLPILAYPLVERASQANDPSKVVDDSQLPAGLLVDVSPDSVMTLLHQAEFPGTRSFSMNPWNQRLAPLIGRWGTVPTSGSLPILSGEVAKAWELWQRAPEQFGPEIERKLWIEMQQTNVQFEYRSLQYFLESLSDTLGTWLKHYPEATDTPPWPAILRSLHLQPRHYLILAPGDVDPAGWATMSMEYAASPGIIRCTATHPTGLSLTRYEAVANVEQTGPSEFWQLSGETSPEVTVLDYQHVVTIALPIPEPPLIDKVVTP